MNINLKLFSGLILLILAFSTACFSMASPPAKKLPADLTDSYSRLDGTTDFAKIKSFAVATPSADPDKMAARQAIVHNLTDKGYVMVDVVKPGKNVLFITFNITNEVEKIEVDIDESAYKQTSYIYSDYYENTRLENPNLTDPSGKALIRKTKITASVESIIIRAYVFSDENTLKEVWESGAGSIEGSVLALPELAAMALDQFPRQSK